MRGDDPTAASADVADAVVAFAAPRSRVRTR
jgi:hypothetical protein